jgi:hypothetical protein
VEKVSQDEVDIRTEPGDSDQASKCSGLVVDSGTVVKTDDERCSYCKCSVSRQRVIERDEDDEADGQSGDVEVPSVVWLAAPTLNKWVDWNQRTNLIREYRVLRVVNAQHGAEMDAICDMASQV